MAETNDRSAADSLLAAAMDAHRQGDLGRADLLYARFIELEPGHAQALRLHGVLARERGDAVASARLLQKACAAAPADSRAFNEYALTCLAQGELHAAEQALRRALENEPDSVRALANLGALLQYRGHLAEAIDCHRQVLAITPEDLEVRCNLASTLAAAGHGEDALAEIDTALDQVPEHPALLATRAAVLIEMQHFSAAAALLDNVVQRNPADATALTNLGMARTRLGDREAALSALRRAVDVQPDNARAAADLVNLLASQRQLSEALRTAGKFLARHPGERLMLASYALALRDAGHAERADALMDLERLVYITDAVAPSGWESLHDFNRQLLEAVLGDDSLLAEPVGQSTHGGCQTGELDLNSSPVLSAFGQMLDTRLHRIVRQFAAEGLDPHPMMTGTAAWTLRAWATVLDAGGYQEPHLHPVGLLSGVYYVSIPADMDAAGTQAGWLEFGLPPARMAWACLPPTRRVEPLEGRLVVFPSWFCHRTLPFDSGQPRVSIAFDLVPLSAVRPA